MKEQLKALWGDLVWWMKQHVAITVLSATIFVLIVIMAVR